MAAISSMSGDGAREAVGDDAERIGAEPQAGMGADDLHVLDVRAAFVDARLPGDDTVEPGINRSDGNRQR